MQALNIILLSGGSGKRLWPLSNDIRSKQFLKIFKTPDNKRESMLQRMTRMIKEVNYNSNITIAAPEAQVNIIREQLGDDINISIEPCRRDTFPAIALAALYLHDVKKIQSSEIILVCPVDPYVDISYFENLNKLAEIAELNTANLSLMGIAPSCPSSKYGYIIPENKDKELSKVLMFKEKPDINAAQEYIAQGALWNSGVFAFRLDYILNIIKNFWDINSYQALFAKYNSLPKISFDYAVVEKEPSINVLKFSGLWDDLGTWNSLTAIMTEQASGDAKIYECENTHVINELGVPLITLGVKNLAIIATPDGILVADKELSGELKNYI